MTYVFTLIVGLILGSIFTMMIDNKPSSTDQPKIDLDKSVFSIEYYPLTKRFYPKFGKYYLRENTYTGIIEKNEAYLFQWGDYGSTESEAQKIIEKFKEQQLKENVQTISVD